MSDHYGSCLVCGRLIPRRDGAVDDVCSRLCREQVELEQQLAAVARPKRGRSRQTSVDDMLSEET